MGKIHLRQFLRRTGLFKGMADIAERVKNGEFAVDGKPVVREMYRFNPEKKKVFWKGKALEVIAKHVYILLHKPEGYLSTRLTMDDRKKDKKTIFALLNDGKLDARTKQTLFAVGRLDEDTSGLLIVTNDGKLSARIAHPRSGIEKTYAATLEKPLTPEKAGMVEAGVEIALEVNGAHSTYKTKGCRVNLKSPTALEISVSEGKKREIRRIFESVENRVLTLERISIGRIRLDELHLKKGDHVAVDKEFIEKRISRSD